MDLAELFDLQRKLQLEAYDRDVDTMDIEERIDYIRWNILAATDELHEVLACCGWKPWATTKFVNHTEAVGELADLLHFILNIAMAFDVTADELSDEYRRKREVNIQRQRDGYTGVKTLPPIEVQTHSCCAGFGEHAPWCSKKLTPEQVYDC